MNLFGNIGSAIAQTISLWGNAAPTNQNQNETVYFTDAQHGALFEERPGQGIDNFGGGVQIQETIQLFGNQNNATVARTAPSEDYTVRRHEREGYESRLVEGTPHPSRRGISHGDIHTTMDRIGFSSRRPVVSRNNRSGEEQRLYLDVGMGPIDKESSQFRALQKSLPEGDFMIRRTDNGSFVALDADNKPIVKVRPDGTLKTYNYNEDGDLKDIKTYRKNDVINMYEQVGYRNGEDVRTARRNSNNDYQPHSSRSSSSDVRGPRIASDNYDARGNVTERRYTDGSKDTYEYGSNGEYTVIKTDSSGRVVRISFFDENGNSKGVHNY